jgi:hypothetical protein
VALRFLLTLIHSAQATPLFAVEFLSYAGITAKRQEKNELDRIETLKDAQSTDDLFTPW